MHYKGAPVDASSVEIKLPTLPTLQQPGAAGGIGGAPVLGAPTLGAPKLGAPVVNP